MSKSLTGRRKIFLYLAAAALVATMVLGACEPRMMNQPKLKAFSVAPFLPNESGALTPPTGAVPVGSRQQVFAKAPPITEELLQKGQVQFERYCAVCHGLAGQGDGMTVQRGMAHLASFHSDTVRKRSAQFFIDVIKNGLGSMPSFAMQVSPENRWAIVAYIRELQLSRFFSEETLTKEERLRFEKEVGHD